MTARGVVTVAFLALLGVPSVATAQGGGMAGMSGMDMPGHIMIPPGALYTVDVEIWPTCIVVPQGYRVALSILGKDYEWDGPAATLSNMKNPMKGCGPFIHDDPQDRPPEVFGAPVTLHTGGAHRSHLLMPIVPSKG